MKPTHHVTYDQPERITGTITCIHGTRPVLLIASDDWGEVTCKLCLKEKPKLWAIPPAPSPTGEE